MACGMTVAPSMDVAMSTVSSAFEAWNQAGDDCSGFGGAMNRPAVNRTCHQQQARPGEEFFENACVAFSNQRTVDTAPMMRPPTNSGRPNGSFQRDRAADHFRQIGGDGSACMKNMKRPRRQAVRYFRQLFAGDDTERFRGLVLDEHAHAVSQHQHPPAGSRSARPT